MFLKRKEWKFFYADSKVIVNINETKREIDIQENGKASLNAPLLFRHAEKFNCKYVLHLHEQLPDVPTVEYAPPGTTRDNLREIPAKTYNIEGHGFIACLDENLEIVKWVRKIK